MKFPNSKNEFQNQLPVKSGNEITFLGKVIALIIPKDVPNLTSPELSQVKTDITIFNKK